MTYTNELKIGDKLETLHLKVTRELNKQFCEALDCKNAIYKNVVHPALLINFSNVPKSPSYKLDKGFAAIHTHADIIINDFGVIDQTFDINWTVVDIYEKRNKTYQIMEVMVNCGDKNIIRRRSTNIYVNREILAGQPRKAM